MSFRQRDGAGKARVTLLLLSSAGPALAERSLRSLAPDRQQNVTQDDYEIIFAEPRAVDALGAQRACGLGSNIRHVAYEGVASTATAISAALPLASSSFVGILEGPGVATPRLLEHVILARWLDPEPLVVLPAYVAENLAQSAESDPQSAGDVVEIFGSARFSSSNPQGYLCSVLQSRTFFCSRTSIEDLVLNRRLRIDGVDTLFAKLAADRSRRLVTLGGEGWFLDSEDEPMAQDLWLRADREPLMFGVMPGPSQEHFRMSIGYAAYHEALARERNEAEWPMDHVQDRLSVSFTDPNAAKPRISIVVVVYGIPRQAENTVFSLSTRYQRNVHPEDYEVVVVENRSPAMLGRERAEALGSNIRYFVRDDPGVSPAPAMNFGVSQARADAVGLMIDGARMATPRVVEHVLRTLALPIRPIIVVPGYHLGPGQQHITSQQGYDETTETKLLHDIHWKENGYRLFEIGSYDEATKNGFLNPLLEGTCLFCTRQTFHTIGGFDERFDLPGGGEVNHDLFDRLCRLKGTRYVVLWGEGTFHQYHGGTSSRSSADRETKLEAFRKQYDEIRGRRFATYEREPLLIGTCPGNAHRLLMTAASLGQLRYHMLRSQSRPEWPND